MPPSLSDIYAVKIAKGDMCVDTAQARAVSALNNLYTHIVHPKKSWFTALLGVHIKASAHTQGVYLHGPVGRGKTHVMDLFFGALPDDIQKQRVHFHAFMLSVHAFLHDQRVVGGNGGVDDSLPKFAAQLAANTRVLCFDEFHVVDVADAMILKRLFTALFDAGIWVVMTSNRAPDDLYKGGLQRDLFVPFIDLINARMDVVMVDNGHDYRLDRIAGKSTYFYPLGAVADGAVTALYHELTDGVDGDPETLTVLGHDVHIPHTAHGVMRAGFADLCERPLAAQDYLVIADRYHTVVLEHVPKFTYDRRNETKRFVILVDILYEKGRRLILSADAPLDRLVADNDHAFEFERTLSRLQEMQGAGWGKP